MKQNFLVAGVLVALGLGSYAAFASPTSDIDRLVKLLSDRLGGATRFNELVTGPDDRQVRSSDVKLTVGHPNLNGSGVHATSTMTDKWNPDVNADVFIDEIRVVVSGTSSQSVMLDMGTTTTRSHEDGTTSDLIDPRNSYEKSTTTPGMISIRIGTSTDQVRAFRIVSAEAATSSQSQLQNPVTGNKFWDLAPVINVANRGSLSMLRVRQDEFFAIAISSENYSNTCTDLWNQPGGNRGCATATSTFLGVRIDVIPHYISTSTRDNFPF